MTMKSRQIREHTIDILFPLAVFFAFAASAVMAILLAANIYQGTVESSDRMYHGATAVAYIQEKLHREDAQGAVRLEQREETTVLVLEQSYGGQDYRTYIYAWEGGLRELFARAELEFDPDQGRQLLEVESFSCQWLEDGLLRIRCVDGTGNETVACVSLLSKEG